MQAIHHNELLINITYHDNANVAIQEGKTKVWVAGFNSSQRVYLNTKVKPQEKWLNDEV